MRTYDRDSYNPAEEEEKSGSALRALSIALVVILILGLIGFGIWSAMDKDPNGPNGWIISGISHMFEEKDPPFVVEMQFRPADSKGDWGDTVIAEVGARIDVRILYSNRSPESHDNVAAWCNLPSCLVYEEGSTKLYNTAYKDGLAVAQDSIATQGLYIGSYAGYEETGREDKHGANAYLYFTLEVQDNGLSGTGDIPVTISFSVRAGHDGSTPTTVQQDSTIKIRK